jgi:peptidyl-prolyl cis-trans isomerase SurA
MNKRMKRLVLMITVFASAYSFAQTDEVIMTIDGSPVYKSEFEYIFRKNNRQETITQKDLDEYMDLFVKFKLKVNEAKEIKLDTMSKLKQELEGYRAQLAHQYLFDNDVTDKLINEAYERMKYDVHASHILVRLGVNDTVAAFNKINEVYARLEKGEKFNDLAKRFSEDPSVKNNGGDLGYFSAFRMVYPFETGVYNTPVGSYSKPIRTRFGYHVVYVHDKRPARPAMRASHILVKVDSTSSDERASKKINEILDLLNKGGDFSELAIKYSDDKVSAANGGDIDWFSPGDMVTEFEDVAHSLAKNGDYSKPFKTQYGWHIVKRTDKKELGSLEDNIPLIKNKINRDDRAQKSRQAKITQLKKEYNYKVNADAKKKLAKLIKIENFSKEGGFKAEEIANKYENEAIFTYADRSYSLKNMIMYIHEANREFPDNKSIEEFIDDNINAISSNQIIVYERSVLYDKYPKFKALIDEYTDGVLLFELTDQKVWGKAIRDTTGLEEFYEANKQNFMWKDRADVVIYSSANKKTAAKVYKLAKKGKTPEEIDASINVNSELNLTIEKGVFETPEHPILKDKVWDAKLYKPSNQFGNNMFYIVDVKNVYPAQPKNINEARGLIVSKYQDHLEQQWVSALMSKHKVEVNKNVLYSIK